MKRVFWILFFLVISLCHAQATNTDEMLAPLDSALSRRDVYMHRKELRLDKLRHSIRNTRDGDRRLALYEKMYEEYYTYRFDSAMSYAKREYALAVSLKAPRYTTLALLHRALLLATSGYYSEAEHLFESVDTTRMDRQLWFTYYWTGLWIYSYWSGYSQGNDFVSVYDNKRNEYIQRCLVYADKAVRCGAICMPNWSITKTMTSRRHSVTIAWQSVVLRKHPEPTPRPPTAWPDAIRS